MCSLWLYKEKHGLCYKSYQIFNQCFYLLLKISQKFHSLKKNENVVCLLWEHRSSEKANSFQIKDGILCIGENRNVWRPPRVAGRARLSLSGWELLLPHLGNYSKSLNLLGAQSFGIQVGEIIFLCHGKDYTWDNVYGCALWTLQHRTIARECSYWKQPQMWSTKNWTGDLKAWSWDLKS